jgi:protein SCO1
VTRSECGWASAVLLLGAIALAACGPGRAEPTYELKGQILAIRPETGEILIKHGDIQGFMPGMTMPFKVKDQRLLHGKTAGDLVTARLVVGGDEAWLSALEKTGTAAIADQATFPPASFLVPVRAGDRAPDATLTDQNGQPLTVSAWRDAAVVITFIYIRCPLPQFCPLMDRGFAEIQRVARDDEQLRGRVRLLSVSFDPLHDTPEALTAHAATVGADAALWRFATAAPAIVDRFAAAFGVNVIRESDGTITHNLRTAVIAPRGRVVTVHDGGDWTAAQVIESLRVALSTR